MVYLLMLIFFPFIPHFFISVRLSPHQLLLLCARSCARIMKMVAVHMTHDCNISLQQRQKYKKKNTKSNSNTCKVVIWTIFRYPRLASFFICFCSYPCTWKWKRLKDFIRLSCGHFLPLPQKPCNLARDERGERTKTMQRLDIEYEVCRTEKKAREHIYRFGQQWQMQRWKTQNHNLYPPRFSIKLYVYNTPISLKRLQSG